MKNVINKNTILALMVIGMMCFWGSMNANAQQFNVQGDLVSSYVWRGMYQTGAVSSRLWDLVSETFH